MEPERNAKHTPGPWAAEVPPPEAYTDLDIHLDADITHWIADTRANGEVLGHVNRTARGEQDANALLIAAAPDLLQALKETLAYWDSCGFSDCEPDCECIVQSVQAAIAKAEGR
jgi:hypothetical protein